MPGFHGRNPCASGLFSQTGRWAVVPFDRPVLISSPQKNGRFRRNAILFLPALESRRGSCRGSRFERVQRDGFPVHASSRSDVSATARGGNGSAASRTSGLGPGAHGTLAAAADTGAGSRGRTARCRDQGRGLESAGNAGAARAALGRSRTIPRQGVAIPYGGLRRGRLLLSRCSTERFLCPSLRNPSPPCQRRHRASQRCCRRRMSPPPP